MLRSRRLTLIAAAVLIGLSGCGDSNPRTTAAVPPAVIHLGSAAGGSTAGGGGAEAATTDRMMMAMQDVTFVIDGDIAELGAAGLAWTLPGGAQPDTGRVAEIAGLLGVEGEVRELPADQGGGWMVGADDYSTATLSVSADGLLSWWYNPAPQPVADVSSVACAQPVEATDAGGTAVSDPAIPECEMAQPEPPVGVPDEAAAREAAQQLFSDMGYATGDLEYEVYADEWGANVTAFLLLDGHRSPISLSVGFGAEGAITWASGSLATPVPAGEYPLVGLDAGLARLNDETGRWSGYWGGPMMARAEMAADDAVVAPAVAGTDTETAPTQVGEPISIEPVCGPAVDCVTESLPPLEPVTVHLDGATLGLTMVWAQDGTIWLLPAYTFTAADGGEYTVIAVDDAFLDLPEPYPTDSLPIDSLPVDTATPIDSLPVDSLPVDTAMPIDSLPAESVPAETVAPSDT